jgi:Family of unknown function (DUF6279)
MPCRFPDCLLRRIIGLATLLLAVTVFTACSLVRLAYDQAPNLLFWRLDSYVDVNGEQGPRLRDAIDRWFDWNRRSQLPVYAAMLARAQREVVLPTTAAAMCAWFGEVEQRLNIALEEAVPPAAELMLSLTPEQLQHIERRLAKAHEESRKNFLQPDPAERRSASLKRAADRFEMVYGSLDVAQRERLAVLLARSAFDPERWLAERRLRQREMLQILATVSSAGRTDRAAALPQAQAAARVLVERATRSPRADYRAYQERLVQDNCALAAAMHNAMSPAQREAARAKLKSWEDDLHQLAAASAANGAAASR